MTKIHYVTWEVIYGKLELLLKQLRKETKVYGVPRGGQIIAGMTGRAVDTIENADVIIDDLIDSGKTESRYKKYNKPFVALLDKRIELQNQWLVFPWEVKANDTEETVEDNITRLLQYLGEDVHR